MPDGVNIPGGPSFVGLPQPPDVPCDPTGDGWRGPPGQQGQPGIQGPPGSSIGGAYYIASYGAKSDGVTDDSAAVSATVAAAIAAGGGMVVLSAGRTLLASAITASIPATVSISIEGMGADVSELYFSNATDGLSFTLAYVASPRSWAGVHLRGFSVTRGPTSPVTANTGIRIAKADDLAPLYQGTSSLRDLLVQGSSGYAAANGWNIGILVSAVGGITIDSVWLLGANPSRTGPAVADWGDSLMTIMGGPYVEGPPPVPANRRYVASVVMSNCYMQWGSCGINVRNYVQGVFITNTTIIAQYDSIRWQGDPTSTGHATGGEELAVTNCTLNAWHRGIYLWLVNQSQVSNTTILRTGWVSGVTTWTWAGIEVNHGGFNSIVGNNVTGFSQAPETGILLTDCNIGANGETLNGPNTIVGNTVGNIYGWGLWFAGASTYNVAAGNNFTTNAAFGGIKEDIPRANVLGCNQWNGNGVHYSPFSTLFVSSQIAFQNSGTAAAVAANPQRWFFRIMGADVGDGTQTGSDLALTPLTDTNSLYPDALTIKRSTGVMTLAHAPIISTLPVNAANDAAAASAGVPVGGVYRSASALMIRTV